MFGVLNGKGGGSGNGSGSNINTPIAIPAGVSTNVPIDGILVALFVDAPAEITVKSQGATLCSKVNATPKWGVKIGLAEVDSIDIESNVDVNVKLIVIK